MTTGLRARRVMRARRETICPLCLQPIRVGQQIGKCGVWAHIQCILGHQHDTRTETQPMIEQFEGEWADHSGSALIAVGTEQTARGTRVSISAEGGWPEMFLTPREAVRLADALLRVAAPEARTARKFSTGSAFAGSEPDPDRTIWLLDADL